MSAAMLLARFLSLLAPEDSGGPDARPVSYRPPPLVSGADGVSLKAIFWTIMGIVVAILISHLD